MALEYAFLRFEAGGGGMEEILTKRGRVGWRVVGFTTHGTGPWSDFVNHYVILEREVSESPPVIP